MFANENDFRFPMFESDKSVLPIANVVAESDTEDEIAQIIAVEEKPKCIHDAITLVNCYEDSGSIAVSAMASLWTLVHSDSRPRVVEFCIVGVIIWYIDLSTKPIWPVLNVVIAR